jgi:hypothetical protein
VLAQQRQASVALYALLLCPDNVGSITAFYDWTCRWLLHLRDKGRYCNTTVPPPILVFSARCSWRSSSLIILIITLLILIISVQILGAWPWSPSRWWMMCSHSSCFWQRREVVQPHDPRFRAWRLYLKHSLYSTLGTVQVLELLLELVINIK